MHTTFGMTAAAADTGGATGVVSVVSGVLVVSPVSVVSVVAVVSPVSGAVVIAVVRAGLDSAVEDCSLEHPDSTASAAAAATMRLIDRRKGDPFQWVVPT
ncbi:hypothetical protein [Gordonia sp. (in: high G+C Gram-positive bacteria)]|uniref:hypothetical protein n=1 Tax=Gordonia sp. (in: high G+C Gram-positive bacteria) TaxID=84139 RepID=UPI003C70B846